MRRSRPLTAIVVGLLALGLGGCGGVDEGDFAAKWNTGCHDLKAAQTRALDQIKRVNSGNPSPSTAAARARKPVEELAAARADALKKLRGLKAPDKWKGFQKQADAAIDASLKQIDDIEGRVKSGSTTPSKTPPPQYPALPTELVAQAENCQGGTGL